MASVVAGTRFEKSSVTKIISGFPFSNWKATTYNLIVVFKEKSPFKMALQISGNKHFACLLLV